MSTHVIDGRAVVPPSAARLRDLHLGRWGLRATAILYLGLAVALPIVAVLLQAYGDGLTNLRTALATPGAVAAIRLTLIMSALCTVINAFFGTLIAYAMVRYRFPGRRLLSSNVDLPFAIPTLVTGVMLVALYGPASPVGAFLKERGVEIAFAPLGILIALLFVTLPFVIRTVQPVLSELDVAEEEAAYSLGAGGWTAFRKVVLPALRPSIAAGALLVFARAIGEFGAVVIIAGNLTGKTLTAPVFIFQLANQFRPEEAAAVASLLFLLSFSLVLLTNRLLRRKPRKI
jgi:sulfate/thiosulfate transport system permease protein